MRKPPLPTIHDALGFVLITATVAAVVVDSMKDRTTYELPASCYFNHSGVLECPSLDTLPPHPVEDTATAGKDIVL